MTPSRASSSQDGGGAGRGGGGERGWMGAMSKEDSSSAGASVSGREGRRPNGDGVRKGVGLSRTGMLNGEGIGGEGRRRIVGELGSAVS